MQQQIKIISRKLQPFRFFSSPALQATAAPRSPPQQQQSLQPIFLHKETIEYDSKRLTLRLKQSNHELCIELAEQHRRSSSTSSMMPYQREFQYGNGHWDHMFARPHSLLWMPLEQAALLLKRLNQLASIRFKVDSQVAETNMDRFKTMHIGNGIVQALYTHRVPGLLYGHGQSALYLCYVEFKIDPNSCHYLQFAHDDEAPAADAANGPMAKTANNNAIAAVPMQPQLFISQHSLQSNEYHAWLSSLYTVQMPVGRVTTAFAAHLASLLRHPSARQCQQQQQQKAGGNEDLPRGRDVLAQQQIGPTFFNTPEGCDNPVIEKQIVGQPKFKRSPKIPKHILRKKYQE